MNKTCFLKDRKCDQSCGAYSALYEGCSLRALPDIAYNLHKLVKNID